MFVFIVPPPSSLSRGEDISLGDRGRFSVTSLSPPSHLWSMHGLCLVRAALTDSLVTNQVFFKTWTHLFSIF